MASPEYLKQLAAQDPHTPLWNRITRLEKVIDILLSTLYKGNVGGPISKEEEKYLDDFMARYRPECQGDPDE